MHAVRAIHASRAAGTITVHRRSRLALAVLGAVLAAAMVPGIASASHGRPHAEVYLPELQQHFAIEYPGAYASSAPANTLLEGLQQHFAIEYPILATSGHGSATHYGPPGR